MQSQAWHTLRGAVRHHQCLASAIKLAPLRSFKSGSKHSMSLSLGIASLKGRMAAAAVGSADAVAHSQLSGSVLHRNVPLRLRCQPLLRRTVCRVASTQEVAPSAAIRAGAPGECTGIRPMWVHGREWWVASSRIVRCAPHSTRCCQTWIH